MYIFFLQLIAASSTLNTPFIERFQNPDDGRWIIGDKIYGPYLPKRTYFQARPDHVQWNVSFSEVDSEVNSSLRLSRVNPSIGLSGVNSSIGLSGVRLILDDIPCGRISCCKGSHCTTIVSGHLTTKDMYLYGRFQLLARVGYPLFQASRSTGRILRKGVKTCWTIIYHSNPHNEIAICWDENPHKVHFSYWFDDEMHRVVKSTEMDLSSAFYMYEVFWYPNFIL